MKKIKNSLLLFRLNTDNDTVKCVFIFFANWYSIKVECNVFDLHKIPMAGVISFHKQLLNDWNKLYRI